MLSISAGQRLQFGRLKCIYVRAEEFTQARESLLRNQAEHG
jgi:hypothetical protein